MDTLSTELIDQIFHIACSDIHGETARSLGLVSKYYRVIAEPLEFRCLAVSGPTQLYATIRRVGRALESAMCIKVQHMLICDYAKEHALAFDTIYVADGQKRNRRSTTSVMSAKHALIQAQYSEECSSFWEAAAGLVKLTSSTLRSLSLLSFDTAAEAWAAGSPNPKRILPVIDGVDFPQLLALTVRHNLAFTDPAKHSGGEAHSFLGPNAPALRNLRVISQSYMLSSQGYHIIPTFQHPLLLDMHSKFPRLSHLSVCTTQLRDFNSLMNIVCGFNATQSPVPKPIEECVANGTLPGELQSAVLYCGKSPIAGGWCGTGIMRHLRHMDAFIGSVHARQIRGLEVVKESPAFPEHGERDYEVLFSEWKARTEED